MFVLIYRDGVLLDTERCEDAAAVEISLPPEAQKTIESLLALESFRIAEALGELVMASFNVANRSAACRKSLPAPPP